MNEWWNTPAARAVFVVGAVLAVIAIVSWLVPAIGTAIGAAIIVVDAGLAGLASVFVLLVGAFIAIAVAAIAAAVVIRLLGGLQQQAVRHPVISTVSVLTAVAALFVNLIAEAAGYPPQQSLILSATAGLLLLLGGGFLKAPKRTYKVVGIGLILLSPSMVGAVVIFRLREADLGQVLGRLDPATLPMLILFLVVAVSVIGVSMAFGGSSRAEEGT